MDQRSRLLAEQKRLLEQTNLEIEAARTALEEKSKQLSLTSKYKSEFLANMSHELRTPLNSLLILSKLLADNTEGTLSDKQVQHARTIWNSGNDLLRLIDDILDLSKVEAGAIELELAEFPVRTLTESIEALFRPIAQSRGLEFSVTLGPDLPATLCTDVHRLQQVLKNLLANAFKFTQRGSVELSIYPVTGGWDSAAKALSQAKHVIAFAVKDSGIGIPRGPSEADLRSVSAGRRRHRTQVRRHRARTVDQSRAREPAEGCDHPAEHAGQRQHVHAVHSGRSRGGGTSRSARSRSSTRAACARRSRQTAQRPLRLKWKRT